MRGLQRYLSRRAPLRGARLHRRELRQRDARIRQLQATVVALRKQVAHLQAENAVLRGQLERREGENSELLEKLEEAQRAGKRQAAPFSKGPPKTNPKRPGRKSGEEYGRVHLRDRPDRVDEVVDVPLPAICPCGCGPVEPVKVVDQFQIEVPKVKPFVRQFRIRVGRAPCGRRIQPRHPLQTSDALGAAAVQLGPNAVGLAAILNKRYALSWAKVAGFMGDAFGIVACRAAYCRAAARLGDRLQPTFDRMVESVSQSPVVNADETSWPLDGQRAWLWAFVAARVTVYRIRQSRGGDVAEEVLQIDFAGILGRDGWGAYNRFQAATHQSCLTHILRRLSDMLKVAKRGQARLPHALRRVFKGALDLRDDRPQLPPPEFEERKQELEESLDHYLGWQPTHEPNARLLKHLRNERPHLFTFLESPEVEATNWPAEQAIRPAVVTRKMNGGNRSPRGARTQEVLTSVLRTCWQQDRDALEIFVEVQRSPEPMVASLDLKPG